MIVLGDGTIVTVSISSIEGAVISVTNKGLNSISPEIAINLQSMTGVDIPVTTAFTYGTTVVSQGSTAVTTTLDWTVGALLQGEVATIDFPFTVVDNSLFPDQFQVKATNITADDNDTNDIGIRNFNVIKCADVLACLPE